MSVMPRETGEHCFWVCDHVNKQTGHNLMAENIPAGSTFLYTDEWQSYQGTNLARKGCRGPPTALEHR